MGGFVNMVFKKDGKIRKLMTSVKSVEGMFDPRFFDANETAINRVFRKFDLAKEVTQEYQPECALLAPFMYGLVVVDFDSKHIYDMQNYCCITMQGTAVIRQGHAYLPELLKRGWVGPGLVSAQTGEPIPGAEYPVWMSAASGGEFCGWLMEMNDRFAVPSMDLDKAVTLAIRIYPPGWTFYEFGKVAAADMLSVLEKRGFELSDQEREVWQSWIADHQESPQTPAGAAP